MHSDPIADFLTRIRNGQMAGHKVVEIPASNIKKEITKAKSKIQQSKETEVTLKEKIKQLKVDIKELDKQVDRGAAGTAVVPALCPGGPSGTTRRVDDRPTRPPLGRPRASPTAPGPQVPLAPTRPL